MFSGFKKSGTEHMFIMKIKFNIYSTYFTFVLQIYNYKRALDC